MKPNILFIHGGPGLDSSYFKPWFHPLEKQFNLIYYDQKGHTVVALLRQLKQYVEQYRPVHIVAHSWGCHLFLVALKQGFISSANIGSVVFIAPMPLTNEQCIQGMEKIKKRFSADDQKRLEMIWDESDLETAGQKFMELVTPYYHYDVKFNLSPLPQLDCETWQVLNKEIGEFDIRSYVTALPKQTSLIYGSSDYVSPEDEYLSVVSKDAIHTIPNAGHYVFAEQQDQTLSLIDKFLGEYQTPG